MQTVFVEGKKVVSELEQPIQRLIVRRDGAIDLCAEEHYVVSDSVFEKISSVKSPEGFAAEISMPPSRDLSGKKWVLALHALSDPGNLGTLLRTALAFGFDGALLTDACVDPYNAKALRAAKGATFKLPLQFGTLETFPSHFHPYIADLKGEAADAMVFKTPLLLLLGNEARGIPEEMQKRGTLVTLPIKPQMESLNVAVAGGILMHLMKRKS